MSDRPGEGSARRGTARWRWAAVMLSASLTAVVTDLLAGAHDGPYELTPQLATAFNLYQVVGLGLAVWASRHRRLDRRSRRAWSLMAVAYVLLSLAGPLRIVFPTGIDFPSPADVLRLAFVPVMLVGLLVLPLRAQDRRERHKVWLDTVVVVVASAMVFWYVEIGPGVTRPGGIAGGALVAALAYPVLDLMLIFGASVVLLRGAAGSVRRPAMLLGLAMTVIMAGDLYYSYRQSHDGSYAPDRWQYVCWLTGHFVLTMAAFVQCRVASQDRSFFEERGARSTSLLPYLAVGLSYALLVLAVRGENLRVLGLVTGAVMITSVVVARQVIALRQNHELAITDPLTGLVNRRQLQDRLRLALVRSARNGQHVATLLVDMNGFKQINDTLGHEAGDQLLTAFGQILRRNVLGLDVVGRLGGDEFAVVLHNIDTPDHAVAVARRIVADMEQPVLIGHTPVWPRAAIGIAMSGPGVLTSDELLHQADLAMYRAKGDGTTAFELYRDLVAESPGRAGVPPIDASRTPPVTDAGIPAGHVQGPAGPAADRRRGRFG